ncbi:unnamed protein product, partial [Adineta ricciae]
KKNRDPPASAIPFIISASKSAPMPNESVMIPLLLYLATRLVNSARVLNPTLL